MAIYKFSRLLCSLAVVALFAVSCGQTETVVDSDAASSLGTESSDGSANDDDSSDAEDSNAGRSDDNPAVEPTAIPAPAATSAPVVEDDAVQDDAVEAQDPTESVIVLGSREEALAFMVGEGFAPSDVECLVDGAFEVFGTYDFIELEPTTSEQALSLDSLIETCVRTVPGPAAGSPPPGTDAALDQLWIACSDGDPGACDNLFFDSPVDSDYEAFGFSCGGLTLSEPCSQVLGNGEIVGPAAGSPPPGTDAELDVLWVACSDGNAEACDDLFFQSALGSDYEAFGRSCGGVSPGGFCEDILGN